MAKKKPLKRFDPFRDKRYHSAIGNTKFLILTRNMMGQDEIDRIAKSAYDQVANKHDQTTVTLDYRHVFVGP